MPKPPKSRQSIGPHLVKRGEWWYLYHPSKRGGHALHTRDRAEAERRLPDALRELDALRAGVGGTASEASLIEALGAFLSAPHGYTRRTRESHAERLTAMGAWLSAHDVVRPSGITPEIVDAWIAHRSKSVARRTINRDIRTLRVCLRWCSERALCPVVSSLDQRELREPQREGHRIVPSPEEMARILDGVPNSGVRLALTVLYCTGVRYEELRRLAVGDLHDGAVWVRPEGGPADTAEPGKGYRERKIPVGPEVIEVVTSFLGWKQAKRGHTAHKNQLHRALKETCGAVGLPKCGLHDLRRAAATEWWRRGVPLTVVRDWLGHRLSSTTERYLCAYRSDAQQVAPTPALLTAPTLAPVAKLPTKGARK